jgi:hypothetical protein
MLHHILLFASAIIVDSGKGFTLSYKSYAVDGSPLSTDNWQYPPGNYHQIFGGNQVFWPVRQGSQEGVVWRCTSSLDVKVTWFSADLASAETRVLVPSASAPAFGKEDGFALSIG